MSQSTVERSKVAVVHADDAPLRSIPVPAVVANVSYVDGVTGGNIFVMTRLGVQRLAAAMMGMDAAAVEEAEELSELDLSAAGEAMNQMMAAAAGATANVLQEEIEISPPETRFFATPDEAAEAYELTPHMTSVGFTLLGEPCRLLQLVPNAFVVRMTRALDELAAEEAGGHLNREGRDGISASRHPVDPGAGVGRAGPDPHARRPGREPCDRSRGRPRPRAGRSRRSVCERPPLRHREAAPGRGRVGRPNRNRAPAREPRRT